MSDEQLESAIGQLKEAIQTWSEGYLLWDDAGFSTFDENFGEKPWDIPVALVLTFEGPLYEMFNGYSDYDVLIPEFDELVSAAGFWYSLYNHYTMVFYPEGEEQVSAYKRYFDFKWTSERVSADFTLIFQEVFEHFEKYPEDLNKLHHRSFEKLIESIFANYGYRTELGPGVADGGVDVRIYQKDSIGEVVTLVQAKKYDEKYPIHLDVVAALKGIVDSENANRGLVVTTSRFLPSAKEFAAKQDA